MKTVFWFQLLMGARYTDNLPNFKISVNLRILIPILTYLKKKIWDIM
jgi:hypothetical protein